MPSTTQGFGCLRRCRRRLPWKRGGRQKRALAGEVGLSRRAGRRRESAETSEYTGKNIKSSPSNRSSTRNSTTNKHDQHPLLPGPPMRRTSVHSTIRGGAMGDQCEYNHLQACFSCQKGKSCRLGGNCRHAHGSAFGVGGGSSKTPRGRSLCLKWINGGRTVAADKLGPMCWRWSRGVKFKEEVGLNFIQVDSEMRPYAYRDRRRPIPKPEVRVNIEQALQHLVRSFWPCTLGSIIGRVDRPECNFERFGGPSCYACPQCRVRRPRLCPASLGRRQQILRRHCSGKHCHQHPERQRRGHGNPDALQHREQ